MANYEQPPETQLFQDLELIISYREPDGSGMNMFDLKGISTWTARELAQEGHPEAVSMQEVTVAIVEALAKLLPPAYDIEYCVTERQRGEFMLTKGSNKSSLN